MDKDKALDAALSQIEKAFGKGSIMRLGQDNAMLTLKPSPPAPSVWTWPSVSAVCPAAVLSKSTVRKAPVKQLWL